MADTHVNFDSISDQPLAWALVPVVVLLAIGIAATIWQFHRRRVRRRQQQEWPHDPEQQIGGSGAGHSWATTRPQEGLNELGQAPPPYEGKGSSDEHGTELRDMAPGIRPPAYPAVPEPVVTSESWRQA